MLTSNRDNESAVKDLIVSRNEAKMKDVGKAGPNQTKSLMHSAHLVSIPDHLKTKPLSYGVDNSSVKDEDSVSKSSVNTLLAPFKSKSGNKWENYRLRRMSISSRNSGFTDDSTSVSSSFPDDKTRLKTYGANCKIFQTFDNEFTLNIHDVEVRRVVKLCFASLAVVFVETSIPKHEFGPFKYSRVANIPIGAAKMLWGALLRSDDYSSTDTTASGKSDKKGHSFKSVDNGFSQGYDIDTSDNDVTVYQTKDPTLSDSCILHFRQSMHKFHQRLNPSRVTTDDQNDTFTSSTKMTDDKAKRQQTQDKFRQLPWLRRPFGQRQTKPINSSESPQDPEEEYLKLKCVNPRGLETHEDATFIFIVKTLIKVGVVKLADCHDGEELHHDKDINFKDSHSREKNDRHKKHSNSASTKKEKSSQKKQRKQQYLQIHRDMQHQYGKYLSSLSVQDGGFGNNSIQQEDPSEDLEDDDMMIALRREDETMVRWNRSMAAECWLKQRHKHNESQKDPWVFEKIRKWSIDDGTIYALQMLPSHLMRSGQVLEANELLQDGNFFIGRVQNLGPENAIMLQKHDIQELERRVAMAEKGVSGVGGNGRDISIRDSILRILRVMKESLITRCTSICTNIQSDNECEKENRRIKGEKKKGGTGRCLHVIGTLFMKYDRNEEALSCFELALQYKKIALGDRHQSVGGTLKTLGSMYLKKSQHLKALKCYREALPIERETLGENNKLVAGTLNSLGMICGMLCHYDESITYYEDALTVKKRLYGNDHLDVAETLNSIGILQNIRGDHECSVQAHEKALQIKKAKLGFNHEECAEILFNIGMVYHKNDDFEKAVDCYQESLSYQKERIGEDHVEVARIMHCLGMVLSDMGEFQNSIKFYEDALRIRSSKLGEQHEDVARTLYKVGLVYQKIGTNQRAVECFEGALRISRDLLGSGHEKVADTLYSLGQVYQKIGKYENALESYNEALKIRKDKLGESHHEVATIHQYVGDVYYVLRNYSKSMDAYEIAFQVRVSNFGSDNIDVAATRNNMGVCLLKLGENENAMECFNEALRIRELRLGPDHEKVGDTLHNIGLVLKNLMRFDEAIFCYENSLRIRETLFGPLHNKVADTIYNIAIVYANSKRFSAALDRYKQVLRTYREMGYNDDHPSVANTLQWIGWVQKQFSKEVTEGAGSN